MIIETSTPPSFVPCIGGVSNLDVSTSRVVVVGPTTASTVIWACDVIKKTINQEDKRNKTNLDRTCMITNDKVVVVN
jgi:hypothetical protein